MRKKSTKKRGKKPAKEKTEVIFSPVCWMWADFFFLDHESNKDF